MIFIMLKLCTKITHNRDIKCSGSKESPHPTVYLKCKDDHITCPYCRCQYVYAQLEK